MNTSSLRGRNFSSYNFGYDSRISTIVQGLFVNNYGNDICENVTREWSRNWKPHHKIVRCKIICCLRISMLFRIINSSTSYFVSFIVGTEYVNRIPDMLWKTKIFVKFYNIISVRLSIHILSYYSTVSNRCDSILWHSRGFDLIVRWKWNFSFRGIHGRFGDGLKRTAIARDTISDCRPNVFLSFFIRVINASDFSVIIAYGYYFRVNTLPTSYLRLSCDC